MSNNMIVDRNNLKYSENYNISGIQEVDVVLKLDKTTVTTNGYVTGTVTDYDGKPIPNATVKIFDQNYTPFMHTVTNSVGKYVLNDVPAGTYKINAACDGYSYSEGNNVTITTNNMSVVDFSLNVNVLVSTNTIAGFVLTEGTQTAVGMVDVMIYDGDNNLIATTATADDGEYLVTGLSDGTYSIKVEGNGYIQNNVSTIVVSGGAIYNLNILVVANNVNAQGTFTGQILDSTNTPIKSAVVGLYSIVNGIEVLVALTTTNSDGRYMFGNVKEGQYKVKAKNTSLQVLS